MIFLHFFFSHCLNKFRNPIISIKPPLAPPHSQSRSRALITIVVVVVVVEVVVVVVVVVVIVVVMRSAVVRTL